MTAFLRQCAMAWFLTMALTTTSISLLSVNAYAEMSASQAASKARGMHGGKVLSVSKVASKNGRNTYKVKLLLKDGRVKTVTVSG